MADNKSTYSSLMNELVDVINEKANASDSKNLEELVATAKTIVKPEGTLEITENKQYDVSGYAFANVNVASSGGGGSVKALLDVTKSTNNLFNDNYIVEDVTSIFSYNDTENVETMNYMFYNASNLKNIPMFNTSKVKSLSYFLYNCRKLESEINLDLSNCTSVDYAFYQCNKVPKITLTNTSKVTDLYYCFSSNVYIKELSFDTSACTKFEKAFFECHGLQTLEINLIKANMVNNMLKYTYEMTNLKILNIKVNLVIGSGNGTGGTDYGHLLTIESLLNTCQECINVNAARTLTVGAANITKLSTVYVKLTNEPEVDATNPKYPMVQCESTDEGAMLVADYMALKQWSLA